MAGSIVNERLVSGHDTGMGYTSEAGKESKILVAGRLAVETAEDFKSIGSTLRAGRMDLKVGGDLTLGAVAMGEAFSHSSGSYSTSSYSVSHMPSLFEVGDLRAEIGGDFSAIGSKVKASGDASISVGGDLRLQSLVDARHKESEFSYTSGWLFKSDVTTSRQEHEEKLVAAGIEAKGSLRLTFRAMRR